MVEGLSEKERDMVAKVLLYGNEVLRLLAKQVENIDSDTIKLIDTMRETMVEASGIGLAAPQIGVSERVIIAREPETEEETIVLINPEIIDASGKETMDEGCLCLPGITGACTRAERVLVRGLEPNGKEIEREYAGLAARILQHEIDHLNGILFIDRFNPIRKKIIASKLRKIARGSE